VHRGFARGLQSVWAQVRAAVSAVGARPVWVTGHSLGGALATLAAVRLQRDEGVTPAGTYTFGSPRVGNMDFYRAYAPITYRHVNNEDVVPHVPIEEMLVADLEVTIVPGQPLASLNRLRYCRYKHVGTLRYFDRHGRLGEGMSDWAMKKDAVMDALAKAGQPQVGAIGDHAIANYIESVQTSLAAGLS
jgi:triacylglycerol lipase